MLQSSRLPDCISGHVCAIWMTMCQGPYLDMSTVKADSIAHLQPIVRQLRSDLRTVDVPCVAHLL